MTYSVPPTRREAIGRQLRSEIVTGRLPPGMVIKDGQLAQRLGVSITPVREAIAQLIAEGLVDVAPNRVRRVAVVTTKNAVELNDVMGVLACAGVEWGIDNLTDEHLDRLRTRLVEFEEALSRKDMTVAYAAGADFSTIMILASGNRELQTHVDLTVTRTQRTLALQHDDRMWTVWVEGYRAVLALLERDERPAAVERYREIYRQVRELLLATDADTGD
ncbi:GntR family transcriptional regulator [Pseudonocardia parietis]|uniref:DNA-binding GntR family transcriptional regulator n=1 Tax=Pseudonocardia parietis TaxID=570936 RepID=A0ABS4VKA4_9PSEU|nr:GntR family transcriptional regulator [Pseudonocardia parietis]MBP2364357.1 DNA-binding GntR family transcriptional regulator [Pseudonocardia parietis]